MVAVAARGAEEPSEAARRILQETGVQGGLVVHVGCGDGRLTTALRAGEGFLVHGLDRDVANVERARATIREAGAYGPVSVDHLAGQDLPYTDNLVNLVVVDTRCEMQDAGTEILRVLTPRGVAVVREKGNEGWLSRIPHPVSRIGAGFAMFAKPVPAEIDDWTHYLHDATNNAVAQDTVVGPPKRYQWHGSPRWSRHHDHMASMSALVSANGRLFYIFDEGSTASILLPSKWFLTGRDAFNGTILWKRPIDKWHTHLWPLKSGPADLPRRLVAIGDRVYVTLGFDAPVSMLDAATGETIRTYDQTAGTVEILCSEGVLFLVVGKPDARDKLPTVASLTKRQSEENCEGAGRSVMAVQAETGEVLWRKASQIVPLTLAASSSSPLPRRRTCSISGPI
jgi:ubiquinone/menaquinone biosynthesis C-methylase UbiE